MCFFISIRLVVIALCGQDFTHSIHLIQSKCVLAVCIGISIGQLIVQLSQAVHLSLSTLICSKLILLNRPYIAPMGHSVTQKNLLYVIEPAMNKSKNIYFNVKKNPMEFIKTGCIMICHILASNVPAGQINLQKNGSLKKKGTSIVNSKTMYLIYRDHSDNLILYVFTLNKNSCNNPNGHNQPHTNRPERSPIIPKKPVMKNGKTCIFNIC